MQKNQIGELAEFYWNEIPKHFSFVELGNFVVMPNHVHGIITIKKYGGNAYPKITKNNITIGNMRRRNPGKQNLSSIIGSYKSIVCRMAHKINIQFKWRSRFYDKIIKCYYEYYQYARYIDNNPSNWKK